MYPLGVLVRLCRWHANRTDDDGLRRLECKVLVHTTIADGNFVCANGYINVEDLSFSIHIHLAFSLNFAGRIRTQFADFTPLSLAHIFGAQLRAHRMRNGAAPAFELVAGRNFAHWNVADGMWGEARWPTVWDHRTTQPRNWRSLRASSNRCRRRARCGGGQGSRTSSHKRRLHRVHNALREAVDNFCFQGGVKTMRTSESMLAILTK